LNRPIKIFGLQRTGTNYTWMLVSHNFAEIELIDNKSSLLGSAHKHCVPPNIVRTIFSRGNLVNLGVICLVKDPYAWIVSRLRLAKQLDSPQEKEIKRYLRAYNCVNSSLLELREAFPEYVYFIRYEDYLYGEARVLADLQEHFDLKASRDDWWTSAYRTKKYPEVDKAHKFDPGYYLRGDYLSEVSSEVLQLVNEELDEGLVGRLGYIQMEV